MRIITVFFLLLVSILFSGCGKTAEPLPPPTTEEIAAATDAAFNGDRTAVIAAIETGMPVDQTDEYGNSLLMLAAFNGHEDLAKALLEADADLSLRNAEGRTALIFASTGPFPATVRLLLEAGAAVNATDSVEHFSPLMFAAGEGHSPVVDVLLEAGADPALQDIDGDTAADFARDRGFTALADKLQNLIDEKEIK